MAEYYADPQAAEQVLATLAAHRAKIESWGLTPMQLVQVAANFAHTYISANPQDAIDYYLDLSGGNPDALTGQELEEFRADVLGALSWQMVGTNGSEEQRELSKALA